MPEFEKVADADVLPEPRAGRSHSSLSDIARFRVARMSLRDRPGYRRLSILVLVCAQGMLTATSASATTPDTIALSPCTLEGLAGAAKCGELTVPENPHQPQGRKLRIAIAVLPATGRATTDPILPLMGGPGEDTIAVAGELAPLLAELRRDRDVLLVDQRGTGRSGALRCKLFSPDDPARSLRHLFPVDATIDVTDDAEVGAGRS